MSPNPTWPVLLRWEGNVAQTLEGRRVQTWGEGGCLQDQPG